MITSTNPRASTKYGNIKDMDGMASGFAYFFLFIVLLILGFFAIVTTIIGSFLTRKIIKGKDKYYSLKRNAVITINFYIFSLIFLYFIFGPWWGGKFALVILPVSSAFLFLFLELIEILKDLILRGKKFMIAKRSVRKY